MAGYYLPVRYGLMAITENFTCEGSEFRLGEEVVIKTSRGIDVGETVGKPREVDEECLLHGELLRQVNDADHQILSHIRDSREPDEFTTCQNCIRERELPMRLVGVEHLFSGDKIIFYFLAENRVDFRELVKELARRYRTRIEMRQIGVRDEARLLADYEHCGRELCCRTFIRNLEPVTMRMAKIQKTTLDPSKISGHCGRLMCCLRFEDEVYATLQAEMPARGAICVTEEYTGEVVTFDMFKQEITLMLPDGDQEVVHLSSIVEIRGRKGRPLSGSYPVRSGDTAASGRMSGRYNSRRGTRSKTQSTRETDSKPRPDGQDQSDAAPAPGGDGTGDDGPAA